MNESKYCKHCGQLIPKESIVCPKCGRQLKTAMENKVNKEKQSIETRYEDNKFYIKTWFMWIMLILFAPLGILLMWKFHPEIKKNVKIIITIIFSILFIVIFSNIDSEDISTPSLDNAKVEVTIIDFSKMKQSDINNWCNENKVNCKYNEKYSETVLKGNFIEQSIKNGEKIKEGATVTITYSLGKKPSAESLNALAKAKVYSETMYMSKKGIYKQLTSEYGENFDKESAQYAIDNLKADWNANALAKAKTYRDTMHMSKNAIYDQLISEYGEQFTKSQAQYAIDHLDD